MPTGYAAEGKKFNRKLGRWEKKETEKAFDYSTLDPRTAALLVSFFRWYPDYFFDLVRSDNATYKLELPQRLLMRVFARYRSVMITGCRGLTKTFVVVGSKLHEGVFFPGEKIRYCAPSQKQSAALASQAFKSIENDYPLLASWWGKNNDRPEMFKITTIYNSEFTMYAPRGDNSSSLVGEEIGQEGEDGFDFAKFEQEITPTNRLVRLIRGEKDRLHINLKEHFIGNASTKQNRAYTNYRATAHKAMVEGEPYDGFCADIPWTVALLGNIRDIAYYKKERAKLTVADWKREMDVEYTGTSENPVLSDEVLARMKKLNVAELQHCGADDVVYILAHDVSYETGQNNAKCSDVVLKCRQFEIQTKRDKYLKQAVYVDSYPPPATEALQARKIKELWLKFCKTGGEATYIVIDARAVGKTVVQELMKPSNDGTPCLCCINHEYADIEQPDSLPVIYPLKASISGADSDYEMIKYVQRESEQGNVELLVGNIAEGVEAYKQYHRITDDTADGVIVRPYKQTEGMCAEIDNLQLKPSGAGFKETRKSLRIQRDRWSALKYGCHFASMLEDKLVKLNHRPKSSYDTALQSLRNNGGVSNRGYGATVNDIRMQLLSKRHGR